ncbi:synaptic vesicle glycoprotein 2C-like [Ostrinia furnacalis]|uniref:synaptic vesicle glycoprotein 2C-like n=1 Tax=Ostrinia furnacalis TaxID=93504 RepID=UPI0010391507|nr:synaptic vesicle glycoprotein 2C-like [Ostrinia furnacalis]
MAEEQAWLVRARSDSENSSKLSFGSIARTMAYTEDRLTATEGGGEPGSVVSMASPPDAAEAESELLDYNDAAVLEQFHEDALRQAGCGPYQAKVALATALAVAGNALELAAIPFVLPSAEIELCILRHEKNWLVLISLVGSSLGAAGWGPLGERLGRRRTLLSCLAVNAVFAAIAAVMPTYGTFMMARFCSAIGSGGIVATSYAYLSECVPRACRRRALPALPAAAAAGTLAAAALARAVLPPTGETTLLEDRRHFSAWHRYLLLCTLPIVSSLVSMIWTQESPRYLLDVGREVDAMLVYQNIHSGNQIRICGKANVAAANTNSEYRLGELSLPGKRRPPALHHVRHSVKMFWQAFFQLFSSAYRSTTLSLGGILLFTTAVQFYLSSYVPTTVDQMENALFAASRLTEQNMTWESHHFNDTLSNVEYRNAVFDKCTFKDMLMARVLFKNCTFTGVAFSNIKTSYTYFEGCLFYNSTIIDTDMEVGRELDEWCVFNASVVRGMRAGCARHADLTVRLAGILAEQTYAAHAMLAAAALGLLPYRSIVLGKSILCAAGMLLSPSIYFVESETALYVVECAYRVLLTLVFYTVCVKVVESYPANLRCTAHGLILSAAYMGGAVVRGVGPFSSPLTCALCAVLCALACACAARPGFLHSGRE